ncbi:MAG: hypothetical protein Q4D62_02300 [Planctomycetia bacterium]|nr:hypothetical protein [Planctomycetia bacterium]
MAKKVINRKKERPPVDEREWDGSTAAAEEKKPAPKKKTTRKRMEKAASREVRLKAFWAVYSQSLQRVKLFEYAQREEADALAAELTETKKTPHFVRMEKQVIDE